MRITILDGSDPTTDNQFDEYIHKLVEQLTQKDHTVEHFLLREMNLHFCTGCFGCWVKTPGECVFRDDGHHLRMAMLHCDFLLWVSPLIAGYPSARLKSMMDKSIPLIHPYFEVVHGEAHHHARYDQYPLTGLLIQPEMDTDSEDIRIVHNLFSRTALNFKSRLCFTRQVSEPVDSLVEAIERGSSTHNDLPATPAATIGQPSSGSHSLLIINGSPRGENSNTNAMLKQFAKGFASSQPDCQIEFINLVHIQRHTEYVRQLANVDAAVIGFPLYTDAMPGIVKAFFEEMRVLMSQGTKPALGYLVQSGFPESAHSRFVEQYLQKFSTRLGCTYLGTMVKGGGEGTREMPENMLSGLFSQLQQIGIAFHKMGYFDPILLKKLASPEKYPDYLIPVFNILIKTGLLNFWWDRQLKENKAFENRNARPYEK